MNERDKGGIGKGERDEGDGDEDVHFEIQMGESIIDHLEAFIHEPKPIQHQTFERLESIVNKLEPLIDELEPFLKPFEALFEKFACDEFIPEFVFDFGFQELLVLEDFFLGSLLNVVNDRFDFDLLRRIVKHRKNHRRR